MRSFFREAISSFRTTGTIRPSSKFLIRNCLKDLDFENAKLILEFGAGNGCITESLLERMDEDCILVSFEINDKFFKHCERKFSQDKRLHLVQKSALDFIETIDNISEIQPDIIISSLPLSLLGDEQTSYLLGMVKDHLNSNGCFVQYQYSIGKLKMLKANFGNINTDFTLRNLPPAFVYQCSNK